MKTITITDRTQIEEIIRKCPFCSVGITDVEGNPYVIPMNFAYHDGVIYLHSGPHGNKLKMLEHNPRICISFCEGHELVYQHPSMACSYSMKSRSVMCRGNVRFIEDLDEKRSVLELFMKQHTQNECGYSEPSVQFVTVWEVKVERLSCKSFGLRTDEV